MSSATMKRLLYAFVFFIIVSAFSITVTFDEWETGQTYTKSMAVEDFKKVTMFPNNNRMTIDTENGDNHLRVLYPANEFGTDNSGDQFKVVLEPGTEYTAEYKLKFDSNFDWRKGGKLPGLCGGDCNTGGRKADGHGFSTRYMWRTGGKLVVYLYYTDQPADFGQDLPVDYTFQKNEWVTLKQRVKLNTGSSENGVLQVWVDNVLKLNRNDIRYMTDESKKIDTFYFSTFYGGSDDTWSPDVTSYARYTDFTIQKIN